MLINVKEFLDHADVQESLYPGKRIVKPCKQIGQYKNHCVVIDWRDPETINIDVRPGLSGKLLAPEVMKEYPVCFQMPTKVKIKVMNDNDDSKDDDDDEKGSKGKSGGGGKKPAQKKKLEDIEVIAARFGNSAEGKIPLLGEIKEMMVMGVEIAKEAFTNAFTELTNQISHAKISATEILSKAADIVTRVQPPGFMKPTGDETANYKYDRDKNANIGFRMSFN
tara:strand:- start:27819 stop:28487 length:669 start_codon:yes stop_codon:yes gene_type:complete